LRNQKKELEKEGVYKDSIVTEITPYKNFYIAEDYQEPHIVILSSNPKSSNCFSNMEIT
jgi:peptide methionine sulfoxide reductase MsrA